MLLKRTRTDQETERTFRDALHVAIGMLGWMIPDTPSVVNATTFEDPDMPPELPKELRDPLAILDRNRRQAK